MVCVKNRGAVQSPSIFQFIENLRPEPVLGIKTFPSLDIFNHQAPAVRHLGTETFPSLDISNHSASAQRYFYSLSTFGQNAVLGTKTFPSLDICNR